LEYLRGDKMPIIPSSLTAPGMEAPANLSYYTQKLFELLGPRVSKSVTEIETPKVETGGIDIGTILQLLYFSGALEKLFKKRPEPLLPETSAMPLQFPSVSPGATGEMNPQTLQTLFNLFASISKGFPGLR
jgi:hypothetical protein